LRERGQNQPDLDAGEPRPSSTETAPEQARNEMARPGIEPGTPRFSEGRENPWLSLHLQDFFW
jgi:hypothetical protein